MQQAFVHCHLHEHYIAPEQQFAGTGKSKGRISQSPWGKPAKGGRTRKPRNRTDAFIHLSRHKIRMQSR